MQLNQNAKRYRDRIYENKFLLDATKTANSRKASLELKLSELCKEHNLNELMFQPGGYPPPRSMVFPNMEDENTFIPLTDITNTKFTFITSTFIARWFFATKKESAERRYGRTLAIEKNITSTLVFVKNIDIYIVSVFQRERSPLLVKIHVGIYDRLHAVTQASCKCKIGQGSWEAKCRHVAAVLYLIQSYGNTGEIQKESAFKLPPKKPRKNTNKNKQPLPQAEDNSAKRAKRLKPSKKNKKKNK